MAVIRIVPNIAADRLEAAKAFYGEVLGMTIAMDLGWIVTFATDFPTTPQISVATEGGPGTPVPDISIEVDNLEEVYHHAITAAYPIEYGPTVEPWGVKRFYVRDPFGRLLNILAHE
jgi:catechol 2,3-dioxygenase-like lactoylglutathione lyase family enzyme